VSWRSDWVGHYQLISQSISCQRTPIEETFCRPSRWASRVGRQRAPRPISHVTSSTPGSRTDGALTALKAPRHGRGNGLEVWSGEAACTLPKMLNANSMFCAFLQDSGGFHSAFQGDIKKRGNWRPGKNFGGTREKNRDIPPKAGWVTILWIPSCANIDIEWSYQCPDGVCPVTIARLKAETKRVSVRGGPTAAAGEGHRPLL